MRKCAQIERAQEFDNIRFKKEVHRTIAQLTRRIALLERRNQRSTASLTKRIRALEQRKQTLARRVAKLSKSKQARQRKRLVKHNISPVEKSHLLEVYFANRNDTAALAREGRQLAKTYGLIGSQITRWFGIFAKMTISDIRRSLKKKA